MAKKKVADAEAAGMWKDAIVALEGKESGWEARVEVAASVRQMVYEDYRRDCDMVARSYVRRLGEDVIALEIQNHRRHKDGDLDAAGLLIVAPASCANWVAAHAWADALEAVVRA